MYRIKINDKRSVEVDLDGGAISVDGTKLEIDIHAEGQEFANVILDNKSYNVSLVDIDRVEKTCAVKVNGRLYKLQVQDKFDQLLQQMGLDTNNKTKVAELKAPMPGLVLSLNVKELDTVAKGDSLLILEAMKMENVLKSPRDGIIKKILVRQGDKVEKNQSLLSFE